MKLKNILFFLFTFFFFSILYSGEIFLYTKNKIHFDELKYKNNNFIVFSAGKTIKLKKNQVEKINFTSEKKLKNIENKVKTLSSKKIVLSESLKENLNKCDELKKKYPGIGGIIILDEGFQKYNLDGSSSYKYHFIGKILNEEFLNWSKLTLYYTEGRSKINIIKARSISEDLSETELDKSKIKIVVASQDSKYFDKMNKTIMAEIPNVKTGSIVEYEYEIVKYNPFDTKIVSSGWFFQDEIPVLNSIYHITYPKEKKLNLFFKNVPFENQKPLKIIRKKNYVTETYQMKDNSPIETEPYMPNISDVKPSLHYTFLENWDYLFDYYRKIQTERMKVNDEIKTVVDKFKTTSSNDTEIIKQLFYWVQTNIKYISIKSSRSSGWAGHPASETFANKYGDCTDVSILLSTMLTYAGIEAFPVIVKTNDAGELLTDIPVADGNHCITEIRHFNKIFYIDPTSETYRYPFLRLDDNDIKTVNYIKGEFNRTRLSLPEENMKVSYITLKIGNNNKAYCIIKNKYTGPYEAAVRNSWRHIKNSQTRQVMQNYVSKMWNGAVFKNFEIENLYDLDKQISMKIEFEINDIFQKAGEFYILKVPLLEKSFSEISLEKRNYPIIYASTKLFENKLKIVLPEGMHLKFKVKNLDVKNKYIEFSGKYDFQENIIYYQDYFKYNQRKILVKDYKLYKNELLKISKYTKNRLFMEKK
jgi:hypothetical protein